MTTFFLLTDGVLGTVFSFPDPGNWNPTNTIEIVGAGCSGGNGSTSPYPGAGNGGGGGAYAKGTNFAPTFPVSYIVNPAATLVTKYCSVWNGTSNFNPTPLANRAYAEGGSAPSGGTANNGARGNNFSPTGFAGGNGGWGSSQAPNIIVTEDGKTVEEPKVLGDKGGGGGGAGGPSGAGAAGPNSNTGTGSAGGAGDNGVTAGVATNTPGRNGTQWDATHGCGSGGGSRTTATVTPGGSYGGGGGGGSSVAGATAGSPGTPALIILTYVPLIPAKAGPIMIM